MNDQVAEVKLKTDIVSIIGERIDLKKAGRNYKASCPFHGEKTASFMVSPELQIFKCFGCFPPGQFVKTPFGYHKIEDVVSGDWVFSGKGNLQKVQSPLIRKYSGDLIRIRTANLTEEVSLTGDHNVFVVGGAQLYQNNYKYLSKRLNSYFKYSEEKKFEKIHRYFPIKKIEARKLKKGMTLLYPIDTILTPLNEIDLSNYITKKTPLRGKKISSFNRNISLTNDFLKLLGYYIAEGSSNRAYIRFSLGNHEKGFAADIKCLVEKILGVKTAVHVREDKNGIEITACNSFLANIFENLCGKLAENKHIPFVLQQIKPQKQMVILEAIFRGDGHGRVAKKAKTYRKEIATVSRVLAEQLTDILLRAGYFPSRFLQKQKIDKKGVNHSDAFTVGWSTDPRVSKHKHIYKDVDGSRYWLIPVTSKKRSFYKGKVYNLRIENDHSYVANTFAVSNCGEAGDAFTFLEKFEGMDFPEALKYLADKVGVKLVNTRTGVNSDKEKILEINTLTSRFYNYLLLNSPVGARALEYLIKDRGLTRQTIEEFQLGYSPEDQTAINKFLIVKKKFIPKEIELAGLGIPRGGSIYDRFRGRVIFPLFDHRGNPIGFSGRLLPWHNQDMAKYINSPETPIYHKSNVLYGLNLTRGQIKKKKVAIVVEGELDAISSYQAGIKNVVAIKGSALTEEQVRLLSRFAPKFILALDSDMAGDAAARRGITIAGNLGVEVKVAKITGSKDPDEAARHDLDGYKKDLIDAQGVWDYLIDSVFSRFDVASGAGKAKISKELSPILGEIEDKIVQAHYLNLVAKKLGVPLEAVSQQVDKLETPIKTETPPSQEATTRQGRQEMLEERLIALAFLSNPKILITPEMETFFASAFSKKLIAQYSGFVKNNQDFDLSTFGKSLPAELFDGFSKLMLASSQDSEKPTELEKELDLVKKELKILEVKANLKLLALEMRNLEGTGEKEKLLKAQNKFNKLASSLSGYEESEVGGIILSEPD